MLIPTALLVGPASTLLTTVQGALDAIARLRVETCPDPEAACSRVRDTDVALVLAHLPPNGADRLTQMLWAVAATRRPCPTLVLVDRYCEHQAQVLLRAGAADYLELPHDLGKLAHQADALTRRLRVPARPPADTPPAGTDSLADLGRLAGQVRRVAPQETTLLLTGETGTGKTRLARLVHDLSGRRTEPFLVVDCGALSANLVESELFGHARGAFTGADRERPGKLAAAGAGTLLLDEVNSLPRDLQAKLLRAVDERVFEPVGSNRPQPVRARLIAASNAPLEQEVAAGRFREDLYYRLNVVSFYLPPLRDRRQSVPALALRFLEEFAARNRPDLAGIDPEALQALAAHDWPGNVRELRNAVERAAALCAGPEVTIEDLPPEVQAGGEDGGEGEGLAWEDLGPAGAGEEGVPWTLARSKEEAEVRRIREALEKHRNNRLRAAAELGISRVGLYKKLHKYGFMERA